MPYLHLQLLMRVFRYLLLNPGLKLVDLPIPYVLEALGFDLDLLGLEFGVVICLVLGFHGLDRVLQLTVEVGLHLLFGLLQDHREVVLETLLDLLDLLLLELFFEDVQL